MSKPYDKTSQKLREAYDNLSDMESSSIRKEIRDAKRQAKKQMTKHVRNAEKQKLRDVLRGDSDDD